MKSPKKIIVIAASIILLAGAAFGTKFLLSVNKYKQTVEGFKFGALDLSKVADGQYIGSCDVDLIQVEVKVKVEDHKITDIVLLQHKNGKGAPAETIIEEVVKKQSLEVDTVSGATNSSKVILKAIEDALS